MRSASMVFDAQIAEMVPYSSHVSPGVLKTTGGDYLVAWRIEGLPFVGREERDLEHRHDVFNRLLLSMRAPDYTNVAFWVHDLRRRGRLDVAYKFEEQFNQQLSNQYHQRLASSKLMCNELYLTMLYRPDTVPKAFAKRSVDIQAMHEEEGQAVAKVEELAGNMDAVLKHYVPCRLAVRSSARGVAYSEILELYSHLLNRTNDPVPLLRAPVGSYLPVSRHQFSARTGDFAVTTPEGRHEYGAIINIKEYAESTHPGILNSLKYLDFEYAITQSFSPVGRQDALKALARTKGMMISSGDKAVSQIVELDQAMDQVASGNFVLGEYHFTLAVYAGTREELGQRIASVRAELSNAGFVSTKEDVAVAASFYSQLPGNWKHRTRLANLSSLNFLGMSPLHSFAMGKRSDNPWGEAVTVLQTTNGQPYYFNFHATHPGEDSFGEKAIGNTMVIGKSGTGKTALVNFLLSQVQRFKPAPTIFFFDKDRGAEIFVRACGGNYLALDNGLPTGFNPLQCDATEDNIQFLSELLKIMAGKRHCTAREEEDLHRAIRGVLDTPMPLRTITNLQKSLPNTGDDSFYSRLRKWTSGYSHGWVFDNPADLVDLERSNIIGFDYTELLDNAEVRIPVIRYLLHRLEGLIDGRRVIYVMDEFWKILEGEGGLKEFAKNKQKTIRKQNGLGIFATQSPEDALRSDISAALVEQTATFVLLPNPGANREDYVDGLKLTEAEYQVVRSLDERSRAFLVKQGHGSAVCRLDLGGMDDALSVISASTDNIAIMQDVLASKAAEMGCAPGALTPETWLPDFLEQRKGRRNAGDAMQFDPIETDKVPA